MTMLVLDRHAERELKRERALSGADRFDEVWDGVYVMAPLANNEHNLLAAYLVSAIACAVAQPEQGSVFAGCNVSDREDHWTKNYRCPDIAVFLKGNPAKDCDTYWLGGPDFAVEIVSPNDRSREKLDFYAKVGVRELLIVDRKPWRLELFRLSFGTLLSAGVCRPARPISLASEVLPLRFSLRPSKPRPKLVVTRTTDQHISLI
jgi:Uma2 family endonuclease